jgi:hypothetical protein
MPLMPLNIDLSLITKDDFHLVLFIKVETGEIPAIVTESTIWTYGFRKRSIKFRIAIKTLHDSF